MKRGTFSDTFVSVCDLELVREVIGKNNKQKVNKVIKIVEKDENEKPLQDISAESLPRRGPSFQAGSNLKKKLEPVKKSTEKKPKKVTKVCLKRYAPSESEKDENESDDEDEETSDNSSGDETKTSDKIQKTR